MNANRYQFNSIVRLFANLDPIVADAIADAINDTDMLEQPISGEAIVNTFAHKAAAIERVKRNAAPSADSIRNARVRARLVDIINQMPDDAETTAADLASEYAADLDFKSAKAVGVLLAAAVKSGEVQASPYHKAPRVYANKRHQFVKPTRKHKQNA